MPPRWIRYEVPTASRTNKRRRAVGGCTCCTKDLFPADWVRFLLPWLLCTGFAALFLWVRGVSWLTGTFAGSARASATLVCEWVFVVSAVMCLWSLGTVHYQSPGFLPLGLTARALAIDLLAERRPDLDGVRTGSAASAYHWEMKKYGRRAGELRTCKRSPAVQIGPLGSMGPTRLCPAKPDRAHFCPFTGRAVLEMDHYCPWLGNCIGHGTRKAFLLSLVYGMLMGLSLVGACSWDVVIAFTSPARFLAALPMLLGLAIGTGVLFVLGLFMSYHGSLALANYTTIEKHEKRDAPRTFKALDERVDVQAVMDAGVGSPAFRAAVSKVFAADKPLKNSRFVVYWMSWAYGPSPWDHGTLSNLTHYFGALLVWPLPVRLGWQAWRPWAVAIVPPSHDAKVALKDAKLAPGGTLAEVEPVGATLESLRRREGMAAAAPILAGRD